MARPQTSFTNYVDDFGQFLVYVGVLVASGLAFFLAFILRGGEERRRLRRWTSWPCGGLVGMVVTGAAQAALTGGGFSAVTHWSIDTQSFGGKFGEQCAAQLVGLAACLVSLHLRRTMSRQFAAFYGLLVAAGAFVLFGHALVSQERWLSIPADIVHVVFVAMWAGGLVGLVTVLRRRTRRRAWPGSSPARRGSTEAGGQARSALGLTRALGAGTSTAVLDRPAPPVRPTGRSGATARGHGAGGQR